MSVVLEAALHYAGRGIPVFPCNIQKRPLTVHGFKDASTDKAQIRAWWEQHPNAIIGLPTGAASGLAVIDLDHKPNKFGIERNGSQALLEITQGEILPDTVEARTPTGGRHIYVRNQPGFKCSTDDELGIDVRAEGGYVCVPPSPGYSFEKPFDFFPVIEAPECLIKILTEGTRKRVHEDHAEQLPIAGPVEADDTRSDDVAQILNEAWNPDDYHDWSTAALALHGLPDGYAIWSAWAARSPKFNVAENLRKWNQTQPTRGIGPKSILARASKQRLSELGRARQQPQTFAMFSGQAVTPLQAGNSVIGNTGLDRFQWITSSTGLTPVLNGNWLVKKVIPAEGIGVIFGRPGSGKTFSCMDIAMHIAAGMPWRGIKVVQAEVAYVSPEAGRLGVNRVIGWARHHGRAWPEGFRLSPVAIDLCSSTADAEALVADIKANQPKCRLVVIDTLNRAMAGGDENDGQDMGKFVSICDLIAKALQAFVLIVHHSGKDAARGSRGHSSLLGAVSLELEVTKEAGQPGTIKVTKMRDGEDGGEYGFNIDSVPLGHDEDGDEVTTGISVEADMGAIQQGRDAQPKGKNQTLAADAFGQFVDDYGRPNPPGTGFAEPGRVRVVDVEAFVEFCAGKMVGGKPHEKRKSVREAVHGLVAKGYFAVNGGLLWRL
jgi:hypothetical protein